MERRGHDLTPRDGRRSTTGEPQTATRRQLDWRAVDDVDVVSDEGVDRVEEPRHPLTLLTCDVRPRARDALTRCLTGPEGAP